MDTQGHSSQPDQAVDERKHQRKITIIMLVVVGILLATFITLLTIFIVSKINGGEENVDTSEEVAEEEDPIAESIYKQFEDYERGKPIDFEKMDLTTAGGESAGLYIDYLSDKYGFYTNAIDEDGHVLPVEVAANINNYITNEHITDKILISLLDFKKAQVYIYAGQYDNAKYVLQEYREEDMTTVAQKFMFYTVSYAYYQGINDTAVAEEMKTKLEALPVEELG